MIHFKTASSVRVGDIVYYALGVARSFQRVTEIGRTPKADDVGVGFGDLIAFKLQLGDIMMMSSQAWVLCDDKPNVI